MRCALLSRSRDIISFVSPLITAVQLVAERADTRHVTYAKAILRKCLKRQCHSFRYHLLNTSILNIPQSLPLLQLVKRSFSCHFSLPKQPKLVHSSSYSCHVKVTKMLYTISAPTITQRTNTRTEESIKKCRHDATPQCNIM